MGKFKTQLLNVKKHVDEIEKETHRIYGEMVAALNSLTNQGMRFEGGYETLFIYLKTKLQKAGQEYDKNEGKPLKDFLDKDVALFVKEIEDTRNEAIVQRKAYNDARAELTAVVKKIEPFKTQVAELQKGVAKKKKALIQSKAFKTKVAGYEKVVDELETFVNGRHELLRKGAAKVLSLLYLEKTKLLATTTLKEISDCTSIHLLAELKEAESATKDTVKKFRVADPKQMLAAFKKWIDEADEMEAVAEEA